MRRRPVRPGTDDGTVLLLTLCFAVIALMLILGITVVSALLLDRRSLQSTADGTALAVAQDVSVDGAYGDGTPLSLDDTTVLQADAEDYLSRSDLPGTRPVVATVSADTVQVVLERDFRLPFAGLLGALGIDPVQTLTASAHATLDCLGC